MQHPIEDSTINFSKAMRPPRKRVSTILAERLAEEPTAEDNAKAKSEANALKREPRRRTIYIPDDTTIMTIHPGGSLFGGKRRERPPISPRTGLDLVTLSEDEEPRSALHKPEKRTGSRRSLAVAPKRAPLQQSTRVVSNVSFAEDVVGVGGGKENLPPGKVAAYQMKAKRRSIVPDGLARSNSHGRMSVAPTIPEDRAVGVLEEKNSNQQRPKTEKRMRSESLKNINDRSPKIRKPPATVSVEPDRPVFLSKESYRPSTHPKDQLARERKDLNVPLVMRKAKERVSQFPVLTEDLANPELYEEQWLDYQEVALTQLLNCIFEPPPKPVDDDGGYASLRKKMLGIYSDPAFPLLHKRLQASLLYGALSIPKEHVENALKLKEDLGLRQKFAKLWIDTYDLTALRAASEAISGRAMPCANAPRQSSSSESSKLQQRAERKALTRFIDQLFIQHEDSQRPPSVTGTIAAITREQPDDFGSYHWCWRRTVLRSLMLVLLLDKAKSSSTIEDCLFQETSPYKSSLAVLQALGNLLLHSLGDIIRPLSHINYNVETIQQPLQEYKYHTSNLAVDLRDGLILARLVEVLLFRRLLNDGDSEDLPLTQHLKYPCPSRAPKVHNVQITLSALRKTTSGASSLTSSITAEDIVDGHREKTLTLLWSLVSEFGFLVLIDWNELRRDIVHRSIGRISEERQKILIGKDSAKLLLMWAQTVAAAKGIDVINFTTSFADSSATEAIVDAYLPFFPASMDNNSSTRMQNAESLSSKLSRLGCSKAFITLFNNTYTRIPTSQETLSTLTFLASRLLPLSRLRRAATTIQRQYRQHLTRLEAHRRMAAMKLAHACAMVVRTRNQVITATLVLQRTWRKVLDARLEAFLRDVIDVQSFSRGWFARRRLVISRKAERRVRGGW